MESLGVHVPAEALEVVRFTGYSLLMTHCPSAMPSKPRNAIRQEGGLCFGWLMVNGT